jgi:hypothetical protein
MSSFLSHRRRAFVAVGGGIPRDSLIAEYLFDTDATDTSGTATTHNATLAGDASVSSGVVSLDGTGDYVTVADSIDLEFTDGAGTDEAFSISMWFKSTVAVSAQNLVTKGDFGASREYQFQTLGGGNSGKLALTIYNSTSPSSNFIYAIGTTAYTINTWHHVVVTYDGSEAGTGIELYFDGSNDTTTQAGVGTYTGMAGTSNDLAIGARFDGSYGVLFTGDMDNVRIYKDKELTASEVTDLFNEGHS